MLKINLFNNYDELKVYKKTIFYILRLAYSFLGQKDRMIVNVILVSNKEIQRLNKEYRNLDKPTDVLSFENDNYDNEIGDIFISIEKVIEQAKAYHHSFERELAFLSLHGLLHCLGYDHLNEEDELEMFELQKKIMEKSKIRR